ncbi:MAG: Fe-Mn family superoxide dismutase [Blastocatellia bacterium]|nr:Fe-Mn family superoxide dismutase [Blastocatellia bacterium]
MNRREAIEALTLGGAALSLTNLAEAQTPAASGPARAFAGLHQPKPLPFNPAKLNGLSEKLVRSHWENNYGGSVKALNAVELKLAAMLQEKDLPAYIYGDVKREEMIRTGSVVLHDHYFGNLGGDGKPGEDILFGIRQTWGSFEAWEAEFKKTGNALAGGAGWAMLSYNFHTGELHNYWAWDHMHNAAMSRPLLVMDMYEHAFHIDFGAAAAKYVDAFMLNVNWQEVNRRYTQALKAAPFLKS